MKASNAQQPTGVGAVLAALDRTGTPVLPMGELFLGRDFLDHFFGGLQTGSTGSGCLTQVAAAARALGLSLVGVDLNGCACRAAPAEGELGGLFVVGCLNGPVSRLIKAEGFFKAMAGLHRGRKALTEAAGCFIEEVERASGIASACGFQALAVTDDIAGTGGLFFSPDYFADQVWPIYRQAAAIAKGAGLRAFFHSDGDTRKVIDLLAKAGYDCIHPVDAQAGLDVRELRKEFGREVCFMGHIDIMGWEEEKIRDEVAAAEEAFRGGGLILGSSCGLSMAVAAVRIGALYPRWQGRDT